MTRRQLFQILCTLATAIEAEARRSQFTTHSLILLSLVGELDRLIDAVVDAPDAEAWRWLEDEV
jgi:hypothetical protein